MKVIYRPAKKEDAPTLAKISYLAGGGTFDLLLKGLKHGVQPTEVMTALSEAENTEYSYHYFYVAVTEGKILGGINVISVANRYKLAPNINPILQKKFGFVVIQLIKFLFRARHLKGMQSLKAPKNSMHINDVAVFPEYQGLGIGQKLIKYAIAQARRENCDYVSLYVWKDNMEAIRFYQKLGFRLKKSASIRRHKYLPHDEMCLMLYKV
jgi:ribosomal protein S18 acetylase RimI-like enzyme